LRFGVASLARTAADQSIDGQLLSAAWRRHNGTTFGASVARSAVGGITRTDADPQSIGSVTYASLLLSAIAARDLTSHVTAGIAVRLREGRADRDVRHAVAADLGIVVHDLPWRDARIALSSFLWRPGREVDDRPAFVAGPATCGSGIVTMPSTAVHSNTARLPVHAWIDSRFAPRICAPLPPGVRSADFVPGSRCITRATWWESRARKEPPTSAPCTSSPSVPF
jgi:hypothetical protein